MNVQDLADSVEQQNNKRLLEKSQTDERQSSEQSFKQVSDTINSAVKTLIDFQTSHQPTVSVSNQKFPKSISTPDVQGVIDALKNLEQPLKENKPDDSKITSAIEKLNESILKLPTEFPSIPDPIEEVTVKNQTDYKPEFKELSKSISKLDIKPEITVEKTEINTKPILDSLTQVVEAVGKIKFPTQKPTDLSPLTSATNEVKNAIQALRFPVSNYILPFRSQEGKAVQAQLSPDGSMPVSIMGYSDTSPATQNITTRDIASASAIGANGQSITIGNPTAGSVASFTLLGIATIRVEVTGIWTGTISSEFSIDGGITWAAVGLHQGAYTTSSWTAGFIGGGNVAGATNYRIRATAAMTGTVVVKVTQSVNEQSIYIANAAPAGNVISLQNSSAVTLTSGSTYTGTGEDVSNFSEMRVSVTASHVSATDGLSIQQSQDNTNWDITDTYTISANTAKTIVVPRQARYFRIVYTNGGTNQSSFRLQSILNRTATAPSSQRASDGYTNETDLIQNQMFGMAFNNSTWDRVRNNTTGVVVAAGATTGQTVTIPTYNASKAVVVLNVSAFTSGSITVTISGVTASGFTYTILTSAAIASAGTTPLRIFPSATPSANAVANDMIPATLKIVTTGTFSLTYGIDYELSA